jgi:hypothetical protein
MKRKSKKTRGSAGPFPRQTTSCPRIERSFDALAYAAALEVLG